MKTANETPPPKPNPVPNPAPSPAIRGWALIGIGTLLSSMTISGFFLGYWIDNWLDKEPIFMLLLGILGLAGAMLKAYKLLA